VGNESKIDELTAADAGAYQCAVTGGRGCLRAFQCEKLNGRRVLSLNRAWQPSTSPAKKTQKQKIVGTSRGGVGAEEQRKTED
jgi:hypothetical protein